MFAAAISTVFIVIAYLVGSISSAILVCRLFGFPDPRTAGSNNPGTTNVLRLAGKQYAIIVLLADMLKGLLPVLVAKAMGESEMIQAFVGLSAVIGHMYPVFFQFQGGKGVATALGVLIGLNWILGLLVLFTWLIVAIITRYSSLSAIIAVLSALVYSYFITHRLNLLIPLMLIVTLILYKHRDNMKRLLAGTESKIRLKRTQ
jgi:glycerol-3-phosphate acyltransferase PlsY